MVKYLFIAAILFSNLSYAQYDALKISDSQEHRFQEFLIVDTTSNQIFDTVRSYHDRTLSFFLEDSILFILERKAYFLSPQSGKPYAHYLFKVINCRDRSIIDSSNLTLKGNIGFIIHTRLWIEHKSLIIITKENFFDMKRFSINLSANYDSEYIKSIPKIAKRLYKARLAPWKFRTRPIMVDF